MGTEYDDSEPPPSSRFRSSIRAAASSPKARGLGWGVVLTGLIEVLRVLAPILDGGSLPHFGPSEPDPCVPCEASATGVDA